MYVYTWTHKHTHTTVGDETFFYSMWYTFPDDWVSFFITIDSAPNPRVKILYAFIIMIEGKILNWNF